jgi:hypothetical protein
MSFSKKFKSIYKSFYYLKTNVTMTNEFLCYFFIYWITFKLIHMFPCSHDILKIQLYKQILQFQHQIKLQL